MISQPEQIPQVNYSSTDTRKVRPATAAQRPGTHRGGSSALPSLLSARAVQSGGGRSQQDSYEPSDHEEPTGYGGGFSQQQGSSEKQKSAPEAPAQDSPAVKLRKAYGLEHSGSTDILDVSA